VGSEQKGRNTNIPHFAGQNKGMIEKFSTKRPLSRSLELIGGPKQCPNFAGEEHRPGDTDEVVGLGHGLGQGEGGGGGLGAVAPAIGMGWQKVEKTLNRRCARILAKACEDDVVKSRRRFRNRSSMAPIGKK
jgi:hypothetical protein